MAIGDGNTARLVNTRRSSIDDAGAVMAHLSAYLVHTPGPLDVEGLEPAELDFFLALPETLRELLRRWNGAFFNGEVGFGTGVEVRHEGAATGVDDDSLVELWGLTRSLSRSEYDEIPNDLVAEAARHAEEAFLPRGLVAIGYGMQHSLVLVSVRPEDRGAVYYWDWYWQYPWKIKFFMERITRATAAFADLAGATDDPNHPDHDAVIEAANGATVVRLHDDFGAWVLSMQPFADADE
jgi:hypothetical protein